MAGKEAEGDGRTQAAGKGETKPPQSWLDVLKVVAMPLVALLVGYLFNSSLNERQRMDADNRMYIEMMGRREDAESSLRKDMFKSILDTFMSKDAKVSPAEQIDQEILSLELLAYNFHEALDIAPLFRHVRQRIPGGNEANGRRKRLERVATEVCERQISALSEETAVASGDADLGDLKQDRAPHLYWNSHTVAAKDSNLPERLCLSMRETDGTRYYRQFLMEVIGFEDATREAQVRLVATRPVDRAQCESPELDLDKEHEIDINFSAGLFDFPMIDNTRLSMDQRCAVAVTNLTERAARLKLVFFPGTRASLKERRFFDDMLTEMRHRAAPSSRDKR